MKTKFLVAIVVACAMSSRALAHGEEQHHGEDHGGHSMLNETPFGRAADPSAAQRTIRVEVRDSLEFFPSEITVKAGEVIRFVVVNTGKHTHEMVLGTMKDLDEHNETMKSHPEMHHDEPGMAQVAPGKSGTIVWQFTKAGDFYFGCLVEDHFDFGMMGKIRVTGGPTRAIRP